MQHAAQHLARGNNQTRYIDWITDTREMLRYVLHDRFQGLAGAGLGRAQPDFELAEGPFDGVGIGRVRR